MKKIIIGIPSLCSGGVEVSLVRFINELSKNDDVKITLLMLKKEGIYLDSIPKNVKIETVDYVDTMYQYDGKFSDIKNIVGLRRKIDFFKFRNHLRKFLKKGDWASYYKLILSKTKKIEGEYDLAIDWHGYGHFITVVIASLVCAKKKAMWIHDEKNEWLDKVDECLKKFDKIYCVGTSCLNNIKKRNRDLSGKLDVFYNMTDYQNIREKSLEKIDFKFDSKKLNIVTVGRLEWQKAYDIAVDIALKLKKKKINFCWYVIGEGTKRTEIEGLINSNDLSEQFKLLGIQKNPFPYVKKCDLYVLCSRHEGYCLATLEAKILGKVIVATDIDSNREQIQDYENGFLCKLDSSKFANKIIEVYKDKKLMKKVVNNLNKENFDNISEFEKLYKLMEE